MKFIRVELRKNDVGSHVMCAACGKFHADFVMVTTAGEPEVGVHKQCIPFIHARRTRRTKAQMSAETP